jgi:CarboxypepD_reg-like domain/TonB-dependent Receptor Plug Domain
MKKIFLSSVLFFSVLFTQSQTIIAGKVIDKNTGEPLEVAFVQLQKNNLTALTDKTGGFSFDIKSANLEDSATVKISYIGYRSKTITTDKEFIIIELEKGNVNLEEVIITSHAGVTPFNTISRIDLNNQPVKSSQDILRTVPGLFIGQHQGGGKAEQIFLRGFDIDHGTDVAIAADGIPVNMVSHAHGQGYADLHFLIPELVDKADFGKGSYYSQQGNFSTAGYVNLNTINSLNKSTVKLEGGQFNTIHGLAMIDILSKRQKEKGTNAYIASELLYSDGPFEAPQHFNRFNVFGKLNTRLNDKNKLTFIASAFNSKWNASGQIPERAVRSGIIGRFGAIDNTEGGYTGRINTSVKLNTDLNKNASLENHFYYSKYHFNLFSNFTFFLNDPVNGDQIRQRESRDLFGYQTKITLDKDKGKWNFKSVYGTGFRADKTAGSELSSTLNKTTLLSGIQLGDINETNVFIFSDKNISVGKWLFNIGNRLDYFNFNYYDKIAQQQLPDRSKIIYSSKFNVEYTVNKNTQLYVKTGKGFHSNDTRVVTGNSDSKNILPASYGADLGVFLKPAPSLLINAALWYQYLQQELVYVGDEGIVEPSGKTRRLGVDLSARYQFSKYFFADMNINFAKPRSIENPKGENYIPLAPTLTGTGGLVWKSAKALNGSIRYRYMKDRPANENNSVIAKGYTITDLTINYTKPKYELGIAVENLFNVKWNESQFNTLSRLKNEPTPAEEIHFTPGTPFFAKIKFSVFF